MGITVHVRVTEVSRRTACRRREKLVTFIVDDVKLAQLGLSDGSFE